MTNHLPGPPSVSQLYARTLWDPKPTTTVKSQKQLAYALGYPPDWRVEREVRWNDDGKPIIRDRIHAIGGKKNNCMHTWFHHDAAQKAAAGLEEEDGQLEGSHLLPPMPLYSKGDVIQVQFEGKWFEATITKRKRRGDEFFYSVQYNDEDATQDDLSEDEIRPGEDPGQLAVQLGFTSEWKASRRGARYILTAPTGDKFTTKKAAMKFFKEQNAPPAPAAAAGLDDVGDPPWRLTGHEWVGRKIVWTSHHKVSGTRKVKVEQVGTIEGYIDATDLDSMGNPGFVSETTGKPANLFHITFPDDPNHPYASHLLNSQDLEEHEIAGVLVAESASARRKRLAAQSEAANPTPSKSRKTGRK